MATVLSSQELQAIVRYANQFASQHSRPLLTLHILIAAMQKGPNMVRPILQQMGIQLEGKNGLLQAAARLKAKEGVDRLSEPEDTLKIMHAKACDTAQRHGALLNSLFYFITMIRMKKTVAVRVMEEAGVDLTRLRQELLLRISNLRPLQPQGPGEMDSLEEGEARDGANKLPGSAKSVTPAKRVRPLGPMEPVRPERAIEPVKPSGRPVGASGKDEQVPGSYFVLDPDEYPLLSKLTVNVTEMARLNQIDPIIGRKAEIEQMIRILRKRKTNNPCLVGDPGVGKTHLVEGLALEVVRGNPDVAWLREKTILSLATGSLVAGTQLRGSFSERMQQLIAEVRKAEGRVIIFIDEIHTIVGAGAGENALDAANELKAVLARGEFPCIGATTPEEYKRYIEKDPALERRFQPVIIKEPSIDETIEICRGIIQFYENHHGVKYDPRAIEAAVRLSARYIEDRKLPGKAVSVLDTAAAMVAGKRETVQEEDVANVVSTEVGIPIERLFLTSENRFREMEKFLADRVVGHSAVLHRICETIKRGFAGFSSSRPLATFLFVGPSGVGKGQTVRALASFLFEGEASILSFQGIEFTEKHSVAKLIGTSPGYVGHEQGGRLTEGMYRRPFRIVVFRDILVAHPDVQELLREMITTGTLTDGKGRRVYFRNSLVVLVQDLDEERYFSPGRGGRVGFSAGDATAEAQGDEEVIRRVARELPSMLLDAVDERLVFHPLSEEEVRAVARLEIASSSSRLKEERNISFELTDAAIEHVIGRGGYTKKGGARAMRATLARTVESYLADLILDGKIPPGRHVVVDFKSGALTCDLGA